MSQPSIPAHILHALRVGGNAEAVSQWLASEDNETALTSAMMEAAIDHEHATATEAKLRFVQLALARGADPNRLCHVKNDPFTRLSELKSFTTLCMVSTQATDLSPRLIDLLLRWGAGVGQQSKVTFSLEDDRTEIHNYSPLACAILHASSYGSRHIAVAHALLRGGASVDAVATITVKDAQGAQLGSRSESIEWVLGEKERREPSLADKAHYLALKAFLLSVRAAGGYHSFVIEQRRTCALVRHLALRNRATTRDCVLKFLARTGERGLFRRVLSYLSPPPPPQPTTYLNLRVMWKENGEETFFKLIRSTTPLMRMFRAYAPKASGYLEEEVHVTQLVFYLPGSEERIEEGWQTGDDLGLEDGDTIMCEPYAGSLVCIRDQIVVVKQKIALVEADQRYLSAENAEEAVARAAAAEAARRVATRE